MMRTTLLFGLAILAQAGIAALALPASWSMAADFAAFAVLGAGAALGLSAFAPFPSALGLGAIALAGTAAGETLGLAAADPLLIASAAAGALAGASAGHFGRRALARIVDRLRGHRAAERHPGLGLSVRIAGQAFSVRDWSVFGLFIDVPKGRFVARQEVMIELEPGTPAVPAEVVRVAGTGVGLRFTGLAEAERLALRRRLLSTSLAA